MRLNLPSRLTAAMLAGALATAQLLAGCAPAVVMVGTQVAVSAVDRRSTGAQVDDQTIEIKVASNAANRYANDVHLNATSYNGIVLLTGEVPSTVVQDEITQIAKSTDRVKNVQNDMVIGPATDLQARTNDSYITGKVKTRLLEESSKVNPIYVKVVTERSVVYLMGIVTKQEAEAAAQIAATTNGVVKVVKVFEYIN
jgi:osmotically-inducible protein OsmY